MNFCQYKDIFGKPNTGIHSYRILGFALFDILLTIIASIFISAFWELNFFEFLGLTIFLFLLGIIVHQLFCVKTKLNNILFKQ